MMSACRGVLGARMGPAGADGVVPAAAGAVQQALGVLELACIAASQLPARVLGLPFRTTASGFCSFDTPRRITVEAESEA
jgi:hypothetical protein